MRGAEESFRAPPKINSSRPIELNNADIPLLKFPTTQLNIHKLGAIGILSPAEVPSWRAMLTARCVVAAYLPPPTRKCKSDVPTAGSSPALARSDPDWRPPRFPTTFSFVIDRSSAFFKVVVVGPFWGGVEFSGYSRIQTHDTSRIVCFKLVK